MEAKVTVIGRATNFHLSGSPFQPDIFHVEIRSHGQDDATEPADGSNMFGGLQFRRNGGL